MTIPEAMDLIVHKVTAEQKGEPSATLSQQYESALTQFPAVMSVAHHLVALKYAPNMHP